MKKQHKILFIFAFIFFVFEAKAKIGSSDNIEISKLSIRVGASTMYHNLGQTSSQTLLGSPSSVTYEDWEMDNAQAKIYTYNGAKIHYLNNVFYSYEIYSSSWSVGSPGGPYIKVGATLNSVASYLPNYASNKKSNSLSAPITNGVYKQISIYILSLILLL